MKQLISALLFAATWSASAQCISTLELETTLAAGESASASIYLNGELNSFTVNLNFNGTGGSWAADMLIYVYAPDGSCVGWGGYDYGVTNGCTDLGSGNADGWGGGWNFGVAGFYTHFADASGWGLSGSGDWVVEVENAFNTSGGATYDLEFVFEGPCGADCPDPEACNYVPEEEQLNPLDEACVYPEDLYGIEFDCDGVCLGDEDGDGICDEEDTCFGDIDECGVCNGTNVSGCDDQGACNFDPLANCDDGSCLYIDGCGVCGGTAISGCMEYYACNYNPDATCDDGSCTEDDECGICGGSGYPGCIDDSACNYDSGASCDDGSCLYTDALGVCGGDCAEDVDGDGICDACIVENYRLDIETVAVHNEGELAGMTTYQVHLVCGNTTDELYSISSSVASPMVIESTSGSWFNSDANSSWNPSGLDLAQVANNPALAYDSYLTIGASHSEEGPFANSVQWIGADIRNEFEPGGGMNVTGGNGTIYLLNLSGAADSPGVAGEDYRILVMQITTAGDIAGELNALVYDNGDPLNAIYLQLNFDSNSICSNLDTCLSEEDECGVCEGPGAIYECGCYNMPEGDCDCDGNQIDLLGICGGPCIADEDLDGICDHEDDCVDLDPPVWTFFPADDTLSCTETIPDPSLTMPEAEDDCGDVSVSWVQDGPFQYPFGCSQSFLFPRIYQAMDAAGNSISDTIMFTVLDIEAPLFVLPIEPLITVDVFAGDVVPEIEAVISDGCDANAAFEVEQQTVTDTPAQMTIERTYTAIDACGNSSMFLQAIEVNFPLSGCTDPEACNFESVADIEDGSCFFPYLGFDCNGNCLLEVDCNGECGGSATIDESGNCLHLDINGCTYPIATNYEEEATVDDGSCVFPCEGEINQNVFDWDEDQAVTIADFLAMLSVFGDVDVDFDGVWDSSDLCVDINACNYTNVPSEPCVYIDILGICGGGCEADGDGDGICDDEDDCVGVVDECGVCNGSGPTEVVIENITILYDSVYAEQIDQWFVFEVGADTTFGYTCAPLVEDCGIVNYQGYDYATVLIGDQCWFAENLRSENYENGDAIPSNLSDDEWSITSSGAVTVFGVSSSDCTNNSPDGDACDPAWSLNEYGRLYNWHAVDDQRALCPNGWHVPTDGEWMTMEMALGMSEGVANSTNWRGTDQGTQMKSTYGWYNDGNGTNSSGFSSLPGNYRDDNGNFSSTGVNSYWWSSSPNGSYAWYRNVDWIYHKVNRLYNVPQHGFSVRCIQDSEE